MNSKRHAIDMCSGPLASNTSLINLLVVLFLGLATGTNVTAAHVLGAGQRGEVSDLVHSSATVAAEQPLQS